MRTSINHHPDNATLLSFAAGSLAEPLAAVVAAHVSLCRCCQATVRDMELVGMALLCNANANSALSDDVAFLEQPSVEAVRFPPDHANERVDQLPRPIARHYGLDFETIPWRRLAPGIWHHKLALSSAAAGDLRLLKIAPGRKMPDHGHAGAELTLVLDGVYSDTTGSYGPGDVQDLDEEMEHQPLADPEVGCICLIASERPARFKGLLPRVFQSLSGL